EANGERLAARVCYRPQKPGHRHDSLGHRVRGVQEPRRRRQRVRACPAGRRQPPDGLGAREERGRVSEEDPAHHAQGQGRDGAGRGGRPQERPAAQRGPHDGPAEHKPAPRRGRRRLARRDHHRAEPGAHVREGVAGGLLLQGQPGERRGDGRGARRRLARRGGPRERGPAVGHLDGRRLDGQVHERGGRRGRGRPPRGPEAGHRARGRGARRLQRCETRRRSAPDGRRAGDDRGPLAARLLRDEPPDTTLRPELGDNERETPHRSPGRLHNGHNRAGDGGPLPRGHSRRREHGADRRRYEDEPSEPEAQAHPARGSRRDRAERQGCGEGRGRRDPRPPPRRRYRDRLPDTGDLRPRGLHGHPRRRALQGGGPAAGGVHGEDAPGGDPLRHRDPQLPHNHRPRPRGRQGAGRVPRPRRRRVRPGDVRGLLRRLRALRGGDREPRRQGVRDELGREGERLPDRDRRPRPSRAQGRASGGPGRPARRQRLRLLRAHGHGHNPGRHPAPVRRGLLLGAPGLRRPAPRRRHRPPRRDEPQKAGGPRPAVDPL
ncbi:MAG: RecJ, partial [uncultured Rubrobacteraceae bacterium]